MIVLAVALRLTLVTAVAARDRRGILPRLSLETTPSRVSAFCVRRVLTLGDAPRTMHALVLSGH